MITIRLRPPFGVPEITSPSTERMEVFPEQTERLVIFTEGQVPVIFKKVEVNGQPEYVETVADPFTAGFIRGSLSWLPYRFPES